MGKLVGERTALAAAVLAFYMSIFFLAALQPPPGWGPCFGVLAGLYASGFVGLVSGYFWARWFAIGLGISGLISGAVSMWQIGLEPVLMFYGGSHGAASLILWGDSVARRFDGRAEWRERFHLDESATHRLGKSIIRVGVSLPYIVMYALAPRESSWAGPVLAGALCGFGAWALLRMRSWGLVALAGGAGALGVSLLSTPATASFGTDHVAHLPALGAACVVLLAWALVPLVRPVARYLGRVE
jgi:hypothetical protein